MALGATIYRIELTLSDLDRSVYLERTLTLARHPSETEERLMLRLLAFALFAEEGLEFGRGLSADDEPALWTRDATGAVTRWIEVGLPEERLLRRACGRAARVAVLVYGARKAEAWWQANAAACARLANLEVLMLAAEETAALAALAARSLQLTCTIQDGQVWLATGATVVELRPQRRP